MKPYRSLPLPVRIAVVIFIMSMVLPVVFSVTINVWFAYRWAKTDPQGEWQSAVSEVEKGLQTDEREVQRANVDGSCWTLMNNRALTTFSASVGSVPTCPVVTSGVWKGVSTNLLKAMVLDRMLLTATDATVHQRLEAEETETLKRLSVANDQEAQRWERLATAAENRWHRCRDQHANEKAWCSQESDAETEPWGLVWNAAHDHAAPLQAKVEYLLVQAFINNHLNRRSSDAPSTLSTGMSTPTTVDALNKQPSADADSSIDQDKRKRGRERQEHPSWEASPSTTVVPLTDRIPR